VSLSSTRRRNAVGGTTGSTSFATRAFVTSLRGGGGSSTSDDYDSDDIDTDTDTDDEDDNTDDDDDEDNDEMESDSSDSNKDEPNPTDDESTNNNNTNNAPVQLILQTTLLQTHSSSSTTTTPPHPLLDQRIEITASRTRTIASLKQSVSRQFKSRPPISAITLRYDGDLLEDDDATLADLLDDYEEEDDEEDNDDTNGQTITVTVDMVPPVDPKFGTEMKERLDRMTNEQVLDAYVANMAASHQNSMDLAQSIDGVAGETANSMDDDDDDDEEEPIRSTSTTVLMRRRALMMKEEILQSIQDGSTDETVWKERLYRTDTPESIAQRDQQLSGFGGSGGGGGSTNENRRRNRGGATMNVKKVMQRNLNVNWPDTIRNILLFLFFGYFGGRSAFSRSIMLLGAPSCILLQARPIKVVIKQIFYAIGQPPGILLSLLPAPQQAIMSCDYGQCMRDLYGDDFVGDDVGGHAIEEEEVYEDGEGGTTDWVEEEEDEEDVVEVDSDDVSDDDEYLRDILDSFEDDDDTEEVGESSTWYSSDEEQYDT